VTTAFACSGGWFLYQCAHSGAVVADRISMFLHALMCLAMIPMLWPWGARVPHEPQVVVLGSSVVWFAVLAAGGRRVILAIKDVHHALMAALMVWMVVMPMPTQSDRSAPGTGGQAGMGHRNGPAPAAVTLAAYCLVATVIWIVEAGTTTGTAASTAAGTERPGHRLPAAAGHAAMSLGAGVLTLAMS
jgi:hypothetical protein